MTSEQLNKRKKFKYNMSFYYQSTIIYFVVFILYVVIRGEFVEDSFKLITRDPIIYFFAFIVSISLIGLLYNLYKNKYMEITDNEISFVSRTRKRTFDIDKIISIKTSKERNRQKNRALRIIRIRIKGRKRPILIRPYDYENQPELVEAFQHIKEKLENR